MFLRDLALGFALVVAACSPQQGADAAPVEHAQATHPKSGLSVVSLTVISGAKVHKFDVEIARTSEEQAKGLMFRTELGPDEGMIFPRNPPDMASFWMKNTPLPLDIIFVREDGRIINIAADTIPYSLDSVSSVGMTGLVLEIPAGRSAELGIKAGDLVEWKE